MARAAREADAARDDVERRCRGAEADRAVTARAAAAAEEQLTQERAARRRRRSGRRRRASRRGCCRRRSGAGAGSAAGRRCGAPSTKMIMAKPAISALELEMTYADAPLTHAHAEDSAGTARPTHSRQCTAEIPPSHLRRLGEFVADGI